jgi:hypothetical protein
MVLSTHINVSTVHCTYCGTVYMYILYCTYILHIVPSTCTILYISTVVLSTHINVYTLHCTYCSTVYCTYCTVPMYSIKYCRYVLFSTYICISFKLNLITDCTYSITLSPLYYLLSVVHSTGYAKNINVKGTVQRNLRWV